MLENDYKVLIEEKKGRWVTIKRTPIFIANGQTIEEAIDSFKKQQEEKQDNYKKSEKQRIEKAIFSHLSTVREIVENEGKARITFLLGIISIELKSRNILKR